MTELEDWKARALKAEGERDALRPLFARDDEDLVEYARLVAVARAMIDRELLHEDLCSVSRAFNRSGDLRDDRDRRANETLKKLIALSHPARGEVDGWRPSREAIAAVIAGFRFDADDVRRAGRATLTLWTAAVRKADAILSLPPLDEGKGKEASVATPVLTGGGGE